VSEITAKTTGTFPAVSPSSARAIKRNIALGAKAIVKKDAAVPSIEIRSIGRLPYLSDNLPISGVDINWQIEKVAKLRPNFLEYAYKIGIIIP
jgi:hypothetical protein